MRWWDSPAGFGVWVSGALHILTLLALAFVVLRAPPRGEPANSFTAALERPIETVVDFELSSSEETGGGGGPTALMERGSLANSTSELPGVFQSGIVPPVLPEFPEIGRAPGPGKGKGRGRGRGDGMGNGLRKPVGKNAVTEGSFTVWTEPEDPAPGEGYLILIEVKLPDKVRRYPRSDLTGMVTGTDGWRQPLPGNASPVQPYLPVDENTVQLQVAVPGAGRLVQDTVQIRSRMLKEEQVLRIVF